MRFSASNEQYIVKKPRSEGFITYPQFRRYLTEAQHKVVEVLLQFGGAEGRAFPSNERIAFETGLTKETVASTKVQLQKLGVATKAEIKSGKQTRYIYTIDVTWRREEYEAESEEYFPPIKNENYEQIRAIKAEITQLQRALNSSRPQDMLTVIEKIKTLTLQMQEISVENSSGKASSSQVTNERINNNKAPERAKRGSTVQIDDKEAKELAEYIVSRKKLSKIDDPIAYTKTIYNLIKSGELLDLDSYKMSFKEYKQEQIEVEMEKKIKTFLRQNKPEIPTENGKIYFEDVVRKHDGKWFALYSNEWVLITNIKQDDTS
jgi:hypothetical protein